MTEFEKFQKIKNDCDEINEIICAAYQAKYLGDLQVSEIQALLAEIISTFEESRDEQRKNNRECAKKMRALRKNNHLCVHCGKPLKDGYKKVSCFECLQRQHVYYERSKRKNN